MTSMPQNLSGLLWGPMIHHLDHIAPLCALLKLPLIVTDAELAKNAQKFYPNLQIRYWDYIEAPARIVSECDALLTTLPRPLVEDILLIHQHLYQKKIPSIWLPHGNSDKGLSSHLIEGLAFEQNALFYGQHMIDFCKAKGVLKNIKNHACIGNYRLKYYRKHASFYRTFMQHLPKDKKKILYAPTWRDEEQSSSLQEALPHLVNNLPDDVHLIVKPHPNESFPPIIDHPNITWLTDFPLIYPLLAMIDIYIGDMSSIGYDFLVFNRPMYFLASSQQKFLKKETNPPILQCGITIPYASFANIYQIIHDSLPQDMTTFTTIRETLYHHAFFTNQSCVNPPAHFTT